MEMLHNLNDQSNGHLTEVGNCLGILVQFHNRCIFRQKLHKTIHFGVMDAMGMLHKLKLRVQWTSNSGGKLPTYILVQFQLYTAIGCIKVKVFSFKLWQCCVSTTYCWYQNWIPQLLISSSWFLPTCRRSVKRISRNRNGCFEWCTDSPQELIIEQK